MGVPARWIIDPESGNGWIAIPGPPDDATSGTVRAGGLDLLIAEVME